MVLSSMYSPKTSTADFNRTETPAEDHLSLPANTVFHDTDIYTLATTQARAELVVRGMGNSESVFEIPRASLRAFLHAVSHRTDYPTKTEVPGDRGIGPHSKYGRPGLEIGHADGRGYVTVQAPDGYPFTFWVADDAITRFQDTLQRTRPSPSPPDGFDDVRPGPYGWVGGNAQHTGGGIFCRVWTREMTISGSEVTVEVIYSVPDCTGVDAGVYNSESTYLGTIDHKSPPSQEAQTDDHCYQLATQLMDALDSNAHRETITSLLGS